MSTEGLILAVIVLVLGVSWLALPIVRRGRSWNEIDRQKEREALLTTYERTLAVIRDLDEDYAIGKLSPADYEAERARWMEQGVAVLQQIETIAPSQDKKRNQADAALDDAIEQAIAKYARSTR